jgi:hypothetical protein
VHTRMTLLLDMFVVLMVVLNLQGQVDLGEKSSKKEVREAESVF